MTRRDDATTRAASYAVGALTAAERRELESEAADDRRLAAETREFGETAALLGLAADPVEPRADLRGRLLASLDDVEQAPAPVVRLHPWRTRVVVALGAAAAAVLVGVVGATAIAGLVAPEPTPSAVDTIVAAEDAEREAAPIAGGGTATLVWSLELGRSALLVDGLATLPAGSTYQLWYVDAEGTAVSAGTFDVGEGDEVAAVGLEGVMSPGDAVAVTVEPTGGSETATTAPIVVIATA